jgi:hypothetical protein
MIKYVAKEFVESKLMNKFYYFRTMCALPALRWGGREEVPATQLDFLSISSWEEYKAFKIS